MNLISKQSSSGHVPAPRPNSSPGIPAVTSAAALCFFSWFFFPLEPGFECIALAESYLLDEISPSALGVPASFFADF